MIRRIEAVAALEAPFALRVTWAGGKAADVDLSGVVQGYVAYRGLRDPGRFSRVRVGEHGWTLDWGGDLEMPCDLVWRLAQEQAGETMPAAEFLAWRKRLALSQERAARALGVSRRTVIYYEHGQQPIPKTIRLACKGAELELAAGR